MTPVDLPLLKRVFGELKARSVLYLWGGKAHPLDADSSTITELDCSGFVQYVIAKATDQKLILPEGSVDQHNWCDARGLRQLSRYSDVQYARDDPNRLFIAFIEPHGKRAGHVWLVCAGKSMESRGVVGVDSRKWNTPVLLGNACAAYEVGAKL